MSHHSFYFDPEGAGLEVFLGKTEARIMEAAWAHGDLTVKKALFYMTESGPPAYTTVMTVMSRLANKGILKRTKVGRGYVYSAQQTRDDFLKTRLAAVRNCLKKNFAK